MSEIFTVENAKAWANERREALDSARIFHPDPFVQRFNQMLPEKSKTLFDSGSWLVEKLRELGANGEQCRSICFAHGQRSFGGDAWQVAVNYANEFAANGDTEEKGGAELAEKRNNELFGNGDPDQ